jgi:cell division protease FtsH
MLRNVLFVVITQVQEGLTFMDWTFPLTGLDLSYVWDPEMWLQLKQAVVWNDPEVFWNKLWDRISYSE